MWDYADIYKKDQFAVSYITFHEWMYKKLKGKKLSDFFELCNYKTFAIYGLSSLGMLFLEEVSKEQFLPAYIIDKNCERLKDKFNIQMIHPDELPIPINVDAIVVCHVFYYNEIADELVRHGCPEEKIISLNDIIFSI